MYRKSKIILIVGSVIFCLDRITKLLVARRMMPGESFRVIKGFFDITLVHNAGAAFGIMAFAPESLRLPFLLVSAVLAVALLLYFAKKTESHETLTLVALAMVIGGAAGNIVDRIAFGYVIDFIDWHWGEFYHWPAFNLADSGITVGVILLGYEFLFKKKTG
ncbi:MAG: signal peptidase II [Nitrospirota bacterium]